MWVDRSECKSFVSNIQTAFKTKEQLKTEQQSSTSAAAALTPTRSEEESMDFDNESRSSTDVTSSSGDVTPRYRNLVSVFYFIVLLVLYDDFKSMCFHF